MISNSVFVVNELTLSTHFHGLYLSEYPHYNTRKVNESSGDDYKQCIVLSIHHFQIKFGLNCNLMRSKN